MPSAPETHAENPLDPLLDDLFAENTDTFNAAGFLGDLQEIYLKALEDAEIVPSGHAMDLFQVMLKRGWGESDEEAAAHITGDGSARDTALQTLIFMDPSMQPGYFPYVDKHGSGPQLEQDEAVLKIMERLNDLTDSIYETAALSCSPREQLQRREALRMLFEAFIKKIDEGILSKGDSALPNATERVLELARRFRKFKNPLEALEPPAEDFPAEKALKEWREEAVELCNNELEPYREEPDLKIVVAFSNDDLYPVIMTVGELTAKVEAMAQASNDPSSKDPEHQPFHITILSKNPEEWEQQLATQRQTIANRLLDPTLNLRDEHVVWVFTPRDKTIEKTTAGRLRKRVAQMDYARIQGYYESGGDRIISTKKDFNPKEWRKKNLSSNAALVEEVIANASRTVHALFNPENTIEE